MRAVLTSQVLLSSADVGRVASLLQNLAPRFDPQCLIDSGRATTRVLERVPVPEADVLEGGLVGGWIGGVDGGFGGKLALDEAVETEGLAGALDVVGDVGGLADELVGLDDEVADVPADDA